MSFKLWSKLNIEALADLKPNFGFRSWKVLSESDKRKIWKHLESKYFFDTIKAYDREHPFRNEDGYHYNFGGNSREQSFKQKIMVYIISDINDSFKARSFGANFLEKATYFNACSDFYSIFMKENEATVIELLSLYGKYLIEAKANKIEEDEKWSSFDQFSKDINEVFSHFGLNLYLCRQGFTPKQDDKILIDIYIPVLNSFSHPKWKKVNQHLTDAFSEYRKNTENGYSNCVTNTVTGIQAYLQIVVNGDTGTGDISTLIKKAQKDNQIPSDPFSRNIFRNIESILMQERQDTGIAHPKKEYATEKSARMVLNISMVFFQHCISF